MEPGQDRDVMYIHHHQGYRRLSLFQQNVLNIVQPNVCAAIKGSLDEHRDYAPFVVVDYGAADGLNSVPMIAECSDQLSTQISQLLWIFNDFSMLDERTVILGVKDRLNELSEYKEEKVELEFLHGDFHSQVMSEDTVDLGISISAVHWLSHRPPQGCSLDPRYPDEVTRKIAAQDWVGFLQSRAKELKSAGRLLIAVYVTSDSSPCTRRDKELITVGPQQVITDMFNEGIITQEEYEYACVFPISFRTASDLQAPFLDLESNLSQSLQLLDITTYDTPDPFFYKWMNAGGEESTSATEEYISGLVNSAKSFYNSFWGILEVTRSKEDHLGILDTFYIRVEEMVRGNLEGFHASVSVALVNIVKV